MTDQELRQRISQLIMRGFEVGNECYDPVGAIVSLVRELESQEVKDAVCRMIVLSNEIELDEGVPTIEEWRAFKHFRNTMRDRFGITKEYEQQFWPKVEESNDRIQDRR